VVNNQDFANRTFSRLRIFKSGHIECLVWDKLGLYPKWKTRKISGHITDYIIGDLKNEGRDVLVFSAVTKTGVLSTQGKSYIATLDINR